MAVDIVVNVVAADNLNLQSSAKNLPVCGIFRSPNFRVVITVHDGGSIPVLVYAEAALMGICRLFRVNLSS